MTETTHLPPAVATPQERERFWGVWLWRAVRKNWILAGSLMLAVTLGATFYTLGQVKIYEASAVILFDPVVARPLGSEVETVDTGLSLYMNKREYYKTQFWILQSRKLASATVQELNLHQDASFLDGLPSDPNHPKRQGSVEAATNRLLSNLSVEPIKESRLAVVNYRDPDPARAQRILSVLVDLYIKSNGDELAESSNAAAEWLRDQVGSLRTDLEKSEFALHEYKKQKNILSVSMDDQSNMLREEMTQLNTALTQVRARIQQVAARRGELLKVPPDDPANLPATELLSNTALQQLRSQFVQATSEMRVLVEAGKGENHPDVRAAAAKAATTREALLAEIKNVIGAVEGDLAALQAEARGLQALFDAAQKKAFELNVMEIEYNQLRRAKDNNERLFSLVIERSKESDLTSMLRINNVRVAQRPSLPSRPVHPQVPVNIAIGLLVGLALGLGAAVGREQLDRSIKTPEDAEQELQLSFLGMLPALGAGEREVKGGSNRSRRRQERSSLNRPVELVVHERPTSGIAEAARAIRTNILFMSPDRPYRTLLVTSAGPAEGKTTVACCIAVAMAQAGRRVVLVDCDMRRPRVHRIFGFTKDVGITTALMNPESIEQACRASEVPNLSVMATGPLPPNPAEILHSEAFAKLLTALRDRFDCVVLDSPPVVPVTDAAVLSTSVDGTVVVVRSFKTRRDVGRRMVRGLRDVGARMVGVVLNAVDLEEQGYGYKQYYYYSRDGYAAQDDVDESQSSPPEDNGGSASTARGKASAVSSEHDSAT